MKKFEDKLGKIEDYALSTKYFNPAVHIAGQCFNNVAKFMFGNFDTVHKNPNIRFVYGYVLSGVPNILAFAVAHAWVEIDGKIIDTTMVADGYNEASVVNFKYLPYKKYTTSEYVNALEKDVEQYPDRLMSNDLAFKKNVEAEGYEIREI